MNLSVIFARVGYKKKRKMQRICKPDTKEKWSELRQRRDVLFSDD